MANRIYCFSLYCEGQGKTKSQAFVSIQPSEQDARNAADKYNKECFPPRHGYYNHQMSMIVIPKNKVLLLAKEYEALK
jgi:hypothetical protein